MSVSDPAWKEFERAVAAFAAALDPTAKVTHNVRLPDRHHGGGRQRDVWIEAKISAHFPVSVLVSCKRYRRKLHSGDLDAFNGELASSNARVGVLYSYSGFTAPAIEKGRVLAIPCCRLYKGEGPEIPSALSFTSYCCVPQIALSLSSYPAEGWALSTWHDVFDLRVRAASGEVPLLDELVAQYHSAETAAVEATKSHLGLPKPFRVQLTPQPATGAVPLEVAASGHWKYYRAKLEAYEVNGSYEFTRGDFKGELATPSVDRLSSEPGPGWERLNEPPTLAPNVMMIVLHHGQAKDALLQEMASKPLVVYGGR